MSRALCQVSRWSGFLKYLAVMKSKYFALGRVSRVIWRKVGFKFGEFSTRVDMASKTIGFYSIINSLEVSYKNSKQLY